MEILDLDQAKEHLKMSHTDHADDDIELKLRQAHDIVAGYISTPVAEREAWDDETAPARVVAAVLVVLEELWRFRGGQMDGEMPRREHGFLSPQVISYLISLRTPVMA